jgi:hypothetical protein
MSSASHALVIPADTRARIRHRAGRADVARPHMLVDGAIQQRALRVCLVQTKNGAFRYAAQTASGKEEAATTRTGRLQPLVDRRAGPGGGGRMPSGCLDRLGGITYPGRRRFMVWAAGRRSGTGRGRGSR